MLASIVLGMASSAVFDIHPLHGLFVAACLALSSTPLVSRFLESNHLQINTHAHTHTHTHTRICTCTCLIKTLQYRTLDLIYTVWCNITVCRNPHIKMNFIEI